MRPIGLLVVGLLLASPASADAMRVLRAKHGPTGKWLQRIDSHPDKSVAAFTAEVAAQFGIPASEISAVVTDWTSTQIDQAGAEQATGTHEGLAVTAPPKSTEERPDELRRRLGGIFAGPPLQKRQRWVAVLEKYPAAQAWLTLLRTPLTPDAKAILTEVATRIKAKISGLEEVLTQAEYDALKTLAADHGLGSLVP